MTSSLRYPRLAAAGFLLAVSLVTLAATLGILWLFVPEVAARIVEQVVVIVQQVADLTRAFASRLGPGH
ncbi:hypothetical protein C5B85_02955 [Pseudoclavibacter sp. AY1F1]|nr:hypothetical protein C5B85_02955 [Pseudoclavibacter sp. AY1F1]